MINISNTNTELIIELLSRVQSGTSIKELNDKRRSRQMVAYLNNKLNSQLKKIKDESDQSKC